MAKGFKKKNAKGGHDFIPTEKKVIRSSEPSTEVNIEIDNNSDDFSEGVKEEFNRHEGLPEPYSDKWNEYKIHVERQFDSTFNKVKFENLQKIEPNWYEYIDYHEPSDKDIMDYFGERNKSWKEFKDDHSESEIDDAKDELRHEQEEIIWSTLFEASDSSTAEKIKDNSDKIGEMGLTIIDLGNSDASENYDTGVFLGVRSAGHDFYESYWIPLWKIFGWLPE